MKTSPSPAQRRALARAAERIDGAICPIAKVHGYAEGSLIESLYRQGWAVNVWPAPTLLGLPVSVPIITSAGRAVVAKDNA